MTYTFVQPSNCADAISSSNDVSLAGYESTQVSFHAELHVWQLGPASLSRFTVSTGSSLLWSRLLVLLLLLLNITPRAFKVAIASFDAVVVIDTHIATSWCFPTSVFQLLRTSGSSLPSVPPAFSAACVPPDGRWRSWVARLTFASRPTAQARSLARTSGVCGSAVRSAGFVGRFVVLFLMCFFQRGPGQGLMWQRQHLIDLVIDQVLNLSKHG